LSAGVSAATNVAKRHANNLHSTAMRLETTAEDGETRRIASVVDRDGILFP